MRLVKRKSPEGQGWRCPRKACRKEVTLCKNTFFAGSHLQLELILRLIHLWSSKTPVGKAIKELKVGI